MKEYYWYIIFAVPLLLAALFLRDIEKEPICPDDFTNSEEKIAAFEEWVNNFYDNNPNAPLSDFSEARRDFYIENDCKEALQRVDDYESGNVTEEQKALIMTAIIEEMNARVSED
jgi:hypothetical protein